MTENQMHYHALYKRLICHPEGKHYKKLGKVGWLMMYLLVGADENGIFHGSSEQIADEMGLYVLTVRAWLRHLERAKYIEIHGDWKDMKIVVRKPEFTGYAQEIAEKGKCAKNFNEKKAIANDNNIRSDTGSNTDKKYIYKKSDTSNNDRGESSLKLLPKAIADAFCDQDNIAFYVHAFKNYSPEVIQRAFERALNTPAERIKKSRGALFNYLLKLYDHEQTNKEN